MARIPIVGISAGSAEECEQCVKGGADDYMSKPVVRRMLLSVVERWIEVGSSAYCTKVMRSASGRSQVQSQEVSTGSSHSGSDSELLVYSVLVAEDTRASQQAVQAVLRKENCTVKIVATGVEVSPNPEPKPHAQEPTCSWPQSLGLVVG